MCHTEKLTAWPGLFPQAPQLVYKAALTDAPKSLARSHFGKTLATIGKGLYNGPKASVDLDLFHEAQSFCAAFAMGDVFTAQCLVYSQPRFSPSNVH